MASLKPPISEAELQEITPDLEAIVKEEISSFVQAVEEELNKKYQILFELLAGVKEIKIEVDPKVKVRFI